MYGLENIPIWLVVILGTWELIWKGIALWRCGRHNHLIWFVVILVLNTAGILPIIYLLFFQKKKPGEVVSKIIKKKRR